MYRDPLYRIGNFTRFSFALCMSGKFAGGLTALSIPPYLYTYAPEKNTRRTKIFRIAYLINLNKGQFLRRLLCQLLKRF